MRSLSLILHFVSPLQSHNPPIPQHATRPPRSTAAAKSNRRTVHPTFNPQPAVRSPPRHVHVRRTSRPPHGLITLTSHPQQQHARPTARPPRSTPAPQPVRCTAHLPRPRSPPAQQLSLVTRNRRNCSMKLAISHIAHRTILEYSNTQLGP